jgi:hypothetical protein
LSHGDYGWNMDTTFRVRYRATQENGVTTALLVEDRGGAFYLFSDDRLQLRFDQATWWPRVSTLLERTQSPWLPVECDEQISLGELPSYIASLARISQPGCKGATN